MLTPNLNNMGETFPCPSCALPCETGFELDNNNECDSCRKTRKVIIAGGRDFDNYALLKEYCDKILSTLHNVEIISGRCNSGTLTFITEKNIKVFGADGLGEKYAQENFLKVTPFPANWETYGKSGGVIRNKVMAQYADYLILFFDGKSKGSSSMLQLAEKEGLKIRIINYKKSNR